VVWRKTFLNFILTKILNPILIAMTVERNTKKKWDKENKDHNDSYQEKYRETVRPPIGKRKRRKKGIDTTNCIDRTQYCRVYRTLNKQKQREYEKDWINKDTNNKIACRLRSRISNVLHKNNKFYKLAYLESLFRDGMTWDNYGFYGWHIDHIIPCASFNLKNSEEQKRCFHYTNLEPLWGYDNWHKGSRHNGVLYRKTNNNK
jgi:hypothetical protein